MSSEKINSKSENKDFVLNALSDVSGTPTANNQALRWDSTASSWIPTTLDLATLDGLADVELTTPYTTSNLVLYYNPTVNASYSGSGTTLYDLSG